MKSGVSLRLGIDRWRRVGLGLRSGAEITRFAQQIYSELGLGGLKLGSRLSTMPHGERAGVVYVGLVQRGVRQRHDNHNVFRCRRARVAGVCELFWRC